MGFNKFNNNSNNTNMDKGSYSYYSTSPSNMIKILVIEKRETTIEAIRLCLNANKENSLFVKSSLFTLYLSLRAMLEKDFIEQKNLEELKLLKSQIDSNNFKTLMTAWETLDNYMYSKGLVKIDFGEAYDSTNPALEDERNNL